VRLLTIICDGSVEDFNSFRLTHSNLFALHQLDVDRLERTMKLLALCSLAAQASSSKESASSAVIPIAAIQSLLQVDEVEVEMWVIEAIADNLLEASIDQLHGVVNITRYAHRSFGRDSWQLLQQRLRVVRKNLANTLETIERSKSVVAM